MTRVVAHRGLHREHAGGPRENTLAAVQGALDAGVTWIEVDVRLSADGEVVLLHDATLQRLWGDPRAVDDVPLSQLLTLGTGDRRVPLLAEALALVAGSPATLLIDIDDPDVAPSAAALVAAAATAPTAWCGQREAMRRVSEVLPGAVTWTAWYSPVPPAAAVLDEATVLNIDHRLVGPAFVDAVHGAGAQVAVWTVDDAARAAALADMGVDSITTNDVEAVRNGLRRRQEVQR